MSDNNSQGRLREHPVSRFEGEHKQFDLNELSQQLRSEKHEATEGHRQIAFYHYGSVTMVLFEFEAGGVMEEHQALGVVSIHVLEGAISIKTDRDTHDLQGGQILVLTPGVRHSVEAKEQSRMLLSVHLHGEKQDDSPHRDSERDTTVLTP